MERILLKPLEAAVLLGIGRTRIYEMLACSEIPSIRIGRSVRVPVSALQRWVDERQNSLETARTNGE